MEGLTQQQAAGQLGWPLGTLQSRLARGRERLRGRLLRRGLAPSAGLITANLSAERAERPIPLALANATIRTAVRLVAAGRAGGWHLHSLGNSASTRGVLKTMFYSQIEIALGAALALAMTTAGALVWAEQALRADAPAQLESPAMALESQRLGRRHWRARLTSSTTLTASPRWKSTMSITSKAKLSTSSTKTKSQSRGESGNVDQRAFR